MTQESPINNIIIFYLKSKQNPFIASNKSNWFTGKSTKAPISVFKILKISPPTEGYNQKGYLTFLYKLINFHIYSTFRKWAIFLASEKSSFSALLPSVCPVSAAKHNYNISFALCFLSSSVLLLKILRRHIRLPPPLLIPNKNNPVRWSIQPLVT